jgi:hypothetical protein
MTIKNLKRTTYSPFRSTKLIALALSTVLLGCGKRTDLNSKNILSADSLLIIAKLWKEDSTGCNLQRDPRVIERLIKQVKLVGKDTVEVNKYLGYPNRIFFNKDKKTYVYFMECIGDDKVSYSNFYFDFRADTLFSYQHALF